MLDLIIYPAHVANGKISRDEIKSRIIDSANENELTVIDMLQYCKSLEKAVSAVLKAKNEDGKTIADLAKELALTLPEVQRIIAEARAEELKEDMPDKKKTKKKTFFYNGCPLVWKEVITYPFKDNPQKYNQEECVDWRKQQEVIDACEKQIADLRETQAVARRQQEKDEKKYLRSHPDCERKIESSIVVP